jgi:hypothetical protein
MNLLLFQKKRLSKGIKLALDFTSGVLDSRITFTRASSGTRVNSSGVIESIASNLPRFDYDPVTLAPKGLLIEEQRTNLLTYSSEFDNSAWLKTNVTLSSGILSPTNSLNAFRVTNTSAANVLSYNITGNFSGTYTFSFYAKSNGGTQNYIGIWDRFGAGSVTVARDFTSELSTTEWRRVSISITVGAGSTSLYVYLTRDRVAATVDFFAFGAQLEAGSSPTSYIPTTSATVTRAADNASMVGSNFSSWYNQSGGTFYVEADRPYLTVTNTNAVALSANDSTPNERMELRYTGSTITNVRFEIIDNGAQQYNFNGGSFSVDTRRLGLAYKLNDFASATNGTLLNQSTSGTLPTPTQLTIGYAPTYPSQINGHIQSIKYYPRRLPNADLQRLTR